MFTKTVIKQGEKIIEQDKKIKKLKVQNKELAAENIAVYEENRELRYELEELRTYKKQAEEIHDDIIRKVFQIQDVARLGVPETEKDKHRNIIINYILKELSDDRKSNK